MTSFIDLGNFTNSKLPLITRGLDTLIYYEFPILVTGNNNHGNRIISSYIEEEEKRVIYMNSILSTGEYVDFVNGKQDYLSVLQKESTEIYLVSFIGESVDTIRSVSLDDLPPDYLPEKDSYVELELSKKKEITLQEIADKFGISVDELCIKDE